MQINGLPQNPHTLTLESGNALTAAWKVGQMLKVTAISDAVNGRVWLQAGRQQFQAQTGQPLRAGQELQVRVAQSNGQRTLLVINQAKTSDPVAQATLRALPRQDSMQPLLANLTHLAGNNANAQKLPPALQQLIREGVQLLSERPAVENQQGLKRAVRDAGIFYEAKLAQLVNRVPGANLGADLKAFLLRMQSALNQWQAPAASARTDTAPQAKGAPGVVTSPTTAIATDGKTSVNPVSQHGDTPPPQRQAAPVPQATQAPSLGSQSSAAQIHGELSRQVDATLARLQLHQLNSVPVAEDRTQSWVLEVPVRGGSNTQVFHLQIEEHEVKQEVAGEHRWSVMLAFDIEPLGPVRARVSVLGQQTSAVFWTEEESSSDLIQHYLPQLQQALEQAGLQVGALACHQGRPPVSQPAAQTHHYIDESV